MNYIYVLFKSLSYQFHFLLIFFEQNHLQFFRQRIRLTSHPQRMLTTFDNVIIRFLKITGIYVVAKTITYSSITTKQIEKK